jgi:hypothetical protein
VRVRVAWWAEEKAGGAGGAGQEVPGWEGDYEYKVMSSGKA